MFENSKFNQPEEYSLFCKEYFYFLLDKIPANDVVYKLHKCKAAVNDFFNVDLYNLCHSQIKKSRSVSRILYPESHQDSYHLSALQVTL